MTQDRSLVLAVTIICLIGLALSGASDVAIGSQVDAMTQRWNFDDCEVNGFQMLTADARVRDRRLECRSDAAYQGSGGMQVSAWFPTDMLWLDFGFDFERPQDWSRCTTLSFYAKATNAGRDLGRYLSVAIRSGDDSAAPTWTKGFYWARGSGVRYEAKGSGWYKITVDLSSLHSFGLRPSQGSYDPSRVLELAFYLEPALVQKGDLTVSLDEIELSFDGLPTAHDYSIDTPLLPKPSRGSSMDPCIIGAGSTEWQQFASVVFQGLVNRDHAKVYLIWDQTDAEWLKRYRDIGYGLRFEWPIYRQVISANELPQLAKEHYSEFIDGLLVYDASVLVPDEQSVLTNILTVIASKERLIPVPSDHVDKWDFPVQFDARGRWESPDEAYQWIITEYPETVSRGPIAHLHPKILSTRDYVVAFSILPLFYWQGMDQKTKDLFDDVLYSSGPNQPVIGLWNVPHHRGLDQPAGLGDEHSFMQLIAPFGKYLLVVERMGNLTFHSGLSPMGPLRSKHDELPQPIVRDDRVYITFEVSDGDNLWYLMKHDLFPGPRWWGNHARGEVTLSWTLPPAALDLIPGVVSYLYQTATSNDCFTAALGGLGYTLISPYGTRYANRNEILTEYLRVSGEYHSRLDLSAVHFLMDYGYNTPGPVKAGAGLEDLEMAAEVMPGLTAMFLDYNPRPEVTYEKSILEARGVPVFHALVGGRHSVSGLVDEIRQRTPVQRPAFIHVFVENWAYTPETLRQVAEQLGPQYEVVSSEMLGTLYQHLASGHARNEISR